MLEAGIDVISTVNVQHLESLNDAIFELTEIRVRETFPDHVLDEADEVVLVDLSPEELQERLRGGQGLPEGAGRGRARELLPRRQARRAAGARAARGRRGRRGPSRADGRSSRSASRRCVERVLALVEPQPKSQRILRRAWRSAQRLGAEIDALWVRRPAGLRPRSR